MEPENFHKSNSTDEFSTLIEPSEEQNESTPVVKGIQEWKSVDVHGTVPWARCWFGSALVGSMMYVFGGFNGKKMNCFLSDLHILDLDTLTWREVQATGEVPTGRYAFSFTSNADGSKIFLFGGAMGKTYFNDVYVLHTKTHQWTKLKTTGKTPASRSGHTAAMVKDQLYIQGGDHGTGQYLSDLHCLDTSTNVFHSLNPSGTKPPPRGWHTVVAVEDNLYFFGGVDHSRVNSRFNDLWVLRTDKLHWDLLHAVGKPPPARYSHTTAFGGSDIAVVGGKSSKRSNDIDIYWLNIDLMCWWQPNVKGSKPPTRYGHSSLIYKGKLFLFGGYDSEKTFNDLHVLTIETDRKSSFSDPPMPQLSQDLKTLVNSPIFIEGKKIFAHRNILVARSVYFSKMLLGQLKEAQSVVDQEITINETQFRTFLNFLMYIYCETLSGLDINEALELLGLANRYQHERLQRDLSYIIEQYLAVDNCCLLLEYAHHNEAQMLRNVCLNFIHKNLDAVKRTPDFPSIVQLLGEYPKLLSVPSSNNSLNSNHKNDRD